jgi:hypothetical protein
MIQSRRVPVKPGAGIFGSIWPSLWPLGHARRTRLFAAQTDPRGLRTALKLACAPQPARGVAGNRVAFHAGFAHVDALAQLPCIIACVTLGNTRTLLLGVLDFLRTRRKAKRQRCARNEVSQLHGTLSKCSPLNAPGPPHLDRRGRQTTKDGHRELDKTNCALRYGYAIRRVGDGPSSRERT